MVKIDQQSELLPLVIESTAVETERKNDKNATLCFTSVYPRESFRLVVPRNRSVPFTVVEYLDVLDALV